MKKVGIVIFSIVLCWFVALVFVPNIVTSYQKVDETGCTVCHEVGSPGVEGETIHGKHASASCTQCHEVTGDTPLTSTCIQCHPLGDPGKCELVLHHEDSTAYQEELEGTSCIVCHSDCEEGNTTTTTSSVASSTTTTSVVSTTTTITEICPAEEIYGENSVEVAILRYVRDNVLSKTPEGREIIKLYYELSPVIVMAIQNDEAFRAEVKEAIDGVLQLL